MQRRDYRGFELMNETDSRVACSPDRQNCAIYETRHVFDGDVTSRFMFWRRCRLCGLGQLAGIRNPDRSIELSDDFRLAHRSAQGNQFRSRADWSFRRAADCAFCVARSDSKLEALRSLPKVVSALWRAIVDAELFTESVKPSLPLGWILIHMSYFCKVRW